MLAQSCRRAPKLFDMQIRNIAHASVRLLCSPVVGVIEALKEALNRPKSENWRQFVVNDCKDYFLPLTGAINGVRKEIRQRKKI